MMLVTIVPQILSFSPDIVSESYIVFLHILSEEAKSILVDNAIHCFYSACWMSPFASGV